VFELTLNTNGTISTSLVTDLQSTQYFYSEITSIQRTTTGKYLVIFSLRQTINSSIQSIVAQYSLSWSFNFSVNGINSGPVPLPITSGFFTYQNRLFVPAGTQNDGDNRYLELTYSFTEGFQLNLVPQTDPTLHMYVIQNSECLNVDFNTLIQNAPTRTPTPTRTVTPTRTPSPTPTPVVGVATRIWDYGPEGRVDGCRCNPLGSFCESTNISGGSMTLITVYMFPGDTPCTPNAFMYTDSTLSTVFYPNGINYSYRPTFVCVGQISTISSNCYRQDPLTGIEFVCGGLANITTNGYYFGDACTP
jgi:hypothetical protein